MANNIQNPYIGLRTYEEADAALFRGRKTATTDLFRIISENDVVVLHAESGEGKSSLLNAGLSPMLRDERFFPIRINFTDDDFLTEYPNFDDIIFTRIKNAINEINHDSAEDVFSENARLDGKISLTPIKHAGYDVDSFKSLRNSSWWLLRNYVLNAYGAVLTPVLIFDQFEEVFTRPKNISWTEDFFTWLKMTLSDEIPSEITQKVRELIGEDASFPKLSTDKHFKAIFSLRTEYIGELDYWAIQRHQISVLKNSRFCLKPLTEDEADEVLALQPAFTQNVREQIKSAICSSQRTKYRKNQLPVIPAMLLSVVSTTATANIEKEGTAFTKIADIAGEEDSTDIFNNIIAQFYHKEIAEAKLSKRDVRIIENILVDDKGKRVRIKADSKELRKIQFISKYKDILENKRLIKCTQINGDEYVELSHDALSQVIIQSRTKETIQNNRIYHVSSKILCSLQLIVTIVVIWDILFRFTEYFENGAEFWHIIRDLPAKGYNAFVYIVSAYAYIKLRYGTYIIHKRYILSGALIITILGYIMLYNNYKPYNNIWFTIVCNIVIIAPLILSLICSNFNKNVRYIMLFTTLSLITGFIWPPQIETIILKLALFIPLTLTLIETKSKLRTIKLIFDNIILFGTSIFLILSCAQIFFPILLTLSLVWFCSIINMNGNERWIMMICIFADGLSLLCAGIISVSHWPYQSILSDLDYIIFICPIIGLILSLCLTPYGNKQIFIKKTLSFNYLKLNPFYKILGVSSSIIVITIFSIYIGRFLNDIASIIWLMFGTMASYLTISYLTHLLFKSNEFQFKRSFIFAVVLSIISATISFCQYMEDKLILVSLLLVIGFAIFIYGISFPNKHGHQKTSNVNLKQYFYYIVAGSYILICLPIFSNGYNIYKYNSYARVWNGTIKVLNASSAQSYFPHMRLEKILNCRLITISQNNKLGVRDYNNVVIQPSYKEIGHTAIYTLSYEKTGAPDCLFFVNEQLNPKIVALSDNLNMVNSITDKLMDEIKYYFTNPTDASVEIATKYINGLYARNEDNQIVSFEANKIVERIILDLINSAIKDKGGIPISYYEDLSPKILNGICYNQIMGDYLYLLPFCTEDFKQKLTTDIIGNTILFKTPNTVYVKDMTESGIVKLKNTDIKSTAYFQLYPLYLLSNKIDTSTKMLETLIEHETSLGNLRPQFISDLIISYHLLGDSIKASKVINYYGNELIPINGSSRTRLSDLKSGEWYDLRYNSPINHLTNFLESYKAKNLLNDRQIYDLKNIVAHENIYKDNERFDFIQIINGDSLSLRHIKYDRGKHLYSYYTYNGAVITPLITSISLPKDNNGPTLTIDYNTHKRHYLYYGTPSSAMNGWILPETIKGSYDHAWRFSEGLAAVEKNGRIGFIDRSGEKVLPFNYYSNNFIESIDLYRPYNNVYNGRNFVDIVFENGLCPIANSDGKYGLINTKGKWVLLPEYDHIGVPDQFGFRKVRKGNNYGLISPKGTQATPIKFSNYIHTISPDSVYIWGDYKSIKETWN